MKKTILAIIIAIFTCCFASAQNDYVKTKAVKNINTTTLPCNKGAEPFSTFIKKFKTSASFRNSRIASTAQNCAPDLVETGETALSIIKSNVEYTDFNSYYTKNEDGYSLGKFAVISADKVVYHTEIDMMCYSTSDYVFNRIDGKWYLTKVYTSM
jgi:hypothetical protein